MEKTLQDNFKKIVVRLEEKEITDEITIEVLGITKEYVLTVETYKKERFGIHTTWMIESCKVKGYQSKKVAEKRYSLITL